LKNIVKIIILVISLAGSTMALATPKLPPYPTVFWINGTLAKDVTGKPPSISGYKIVFYNNKGKATDGYAIAETAADGKFNVNAMDDLRMLPLADGTYYIGVVAKGDYGVSETAVPLRATDLAAGYKTVALALEKDGGIIDPTLGPGPLAITTPPVLTAGKVGVDYSFDLKATGGTAPFRWELEPGSTLPPGLSLATATGSISGKPTTTGSYTFKIKITDASLPSPRSEIKDFSLTITPPTGTGPILNLTVLPEGFIGKPTTLLVKTDTDSGECVVPLDKDGKGTNGGTWIKAPPSGKNYHLIIHHRLGAGEGNHLPFRSKDKYPLSVGTPTAIDFSDPDPASIRAHTPPAKVRALKIHSAGKKAMRAGYLNDDKIIDVADYAVWKGKVTPSGAIDSKDTDSISLDLYGVNSFVVSD
jgi:hypothetical protein